MFFPGFNLGQLLRWEAVQKSMDILEGYTHSDTIFGKPLKAALIDSSHEFYHGSKERATVSKTDF